MKNKHVALFVLVLLLIAGGLFLWLTKASNNGGAALFTGAVPYQTCPSSGYKYITQWGTSGSGNGQFNSPFDVAVDSNGYVYVTDQFNQRIQKFDSNGVYITQWGGFAALGNPTVQTGPAGSQGTVMYSPVGPTGIAVDSLNNVYVADPGNYKIKKFNSSGTLVTSWGSFGTGNTQFNNYLMDVAVDSLNNVYVSDQDNQVIKKFNTSGGFLSSFGSLNGQHIFTNPHWVGVDSSGKIYVNDGQNIIQKFTGTGQRLAQWGGIVGTGNGQFNNPAGIVADPNNQVFIVDANNNRVQIVDNLGTYISQFGGIGSGNGQFRLPTGIAMDNTGNIYIVDTGNNRIQKFSPCKKITGFPTQTLKPDLVVDNFTWQPVAPKVRVITNPVNEPTPNTNFQINAVIKNIGLGTAILPIGTQISLTKGGVSYGAQQLMSPVTLTSGQTYNVTIYQSTTPNIRGVAGTFNIIVNVDDYAGGSPYSAPANRVTESNEANNSLTKSLTILP